MINLLSLSQLEHKAHETDNALALEILSRLDEEVESSVEAALETNDADYSYKISDAVHAIECLLKTPWFKVEETRHTKDKIIYQLRGLHEDTSPYNNHIEIYKYKGSDSWKLKANGGQYGEDVRETSLVASGFKDAQEKACKKIIGMIKDGLELNID